MATPRDYEIGAAALEKVVQGDINQDVPAMWRGMIPAHLATNLGVQGAKAVIDAVDADRSKQAAANPVNKGAPS